MTVNVYVTGPVTITSDPAVASALDSIEIALAQLKGQIMHTLDELLAAVTAESTKLDSVKTLILSLKQQIADALAGANLSPANQAKVDAVFDAATNNAGKIDDALTANTP